MRRKNIPQQDAMPRQESALWLGRALSTNEVLLRALLQTMDIVQVQQQVIQALHERARADAQHGDPSEALEQMEQGLSAELQAKLADLREQLAPILDMVDESCRTLEGML
jgi:hypothetical protein